MKTELTYNEVTIPVDDIHLKGNLREAQNAKGIILFSHGSGSSRLSSRNNYVADYLLENGFSSLLFDLLTTKEDMVYENRFDIPLLTYRLVEVINWMRKNEAIKDLPIGLFGASTGAASALNTSAELSNIVKAVVSRGGRPDLAMANLHLVKAPTLLLVGGDDGVVIELNKKAQDNINGICELKIIEGATHLFSEPGKLQMVAKETKDWFNKYLKVKKQKHV